MVIYEHLNWFREFDPKRHFPIVNWKETNKPLGGLWGSRVGASKKWERFLEQMDEYLQKKHHVENWERTEVTRFYFKLKEDANVFVVTCYKDYLRLPKSVDEDGKEYVDYLKCLDNGIDAVELCSIGDEFEEYYDEETIDEFDDAFCIQWACDSIVVLNPDAYEIIDAPAA